MPDEVEELREQLRKWRTMHASMIEELDDLLGDSDDENEVIHITVGHVLRWISTLEK